MSFSPKFIGLVLSNAAARGTRREKGEWNCSVFFFLRCLLCTAVGGCRLVTGGNDASDGGVAETDLAEQVDGGCLRKVEDPQRCTNRVLQPKIVTRSGRR